MCVTVSIVPVRSTVQCTVIRYGTVIWCKTVFIQFLTIYTVKYSSVYGTVQKAGIWLFLHQKAILAHVYKIQML